MSAALLREMLQKRVSDPKRTFSIDAHHVADALNVNRFDGSSFQQAAIVETHIAAAKIVQGSSQQGRGSRFDAQVSSHRHAGPGQLRGEAVQFLA